MQWNISSQKEEIYQEIRETQPHIIFLQETRT